MKNLCSRRFSTELEIYWEKIAKSRFVPPFGGVRGNVHGSSMAYWKARGRLPISANWTFFGSSHGWGAISKYWSKLCCLKGGGSIWAQISGGRRGLPKEFWRQKTRVPGLSRGVVFVILHLAVLIQYRRVTHTHTDIQTHRHTMMAITRALLAPRGQKCFRTGSNCLGTEWT